MRWNGKRVAGLALAFAIVEGAGLLGACSAEAAVVLCQRKSKIKLRLDACKSKETLLAPTELGLAAPPRWALVDSDGSILAQSGGISVVGMDGAGRFVLNFGASLAGRTLSIVAAVTESDVAFRGTMAVTKCDAGMVIAGACVGLGGPGAGVDGFVFAATTNQTNDGAEPHAFFVSAL